MRAIPVILATILVAVCTTTTAFSPLQYQREQSFKFHEGNSNPSKSSLLKAFTKARLPEAVLPDSYELQITPILNAGITNFPQFTAHGFVKIVVTAVTATNVITLNAVSLTIDAASITVIPVDDADPTTFIVDGEEEAAKEFYHLKLDKALTAGKKYTVYIKFVSKVETDPTKLSGLYLSSYEDAGIINNIATTQFEATAARQAFPCFDEPWIKATFKISIGYNPDPATGFIALSNEDNDGEPVALDYPVIPVTPPAPAWLKNNFKTTVQMPTYLVALIVGRFDYVAAADDLYEKTVGIYHTPPQSGGGQYAADISTKLLKFFEDHYEIDYKLSKMYSVAMPDFEFGAMENYGLNIYREAYLLNHAGITTETERELISLVFAHELAHQWFGNLVTCEWWSQIWLNEGFATYNENKAIQVIQPEFDSVSTKQNDIFQVAMVYDGNPAATHPVINAANYDHTNVELMKFFDRITYQKGGSLVYMMEGFLGEDTFKAGLTRYLTANTFKAAHQDDLFAVLTQQAHDDGKLPAEVTVKDIMDTWTLQDGYPLVRVTKASATRIYLTQERFSNSVTYAEESELNPDELWTIPVSVATSSGDFADAIPEFWINKDVLLKAEEYDTSKWLVVNAGATGFYRVLYDTPLTNLLVTQLETDASQISSISRSQFIDDYFTLAAHKFINIETALDFTIYLRVEEEIVVWNTVLTQLRPIFNKLTSTGEAFGAFKSYWTPRLEGALAAIGAEQLPEQTGVNVILRAQLLDWACALEQTACRTYATKLFADWNADPTKLIPVDIRPVVYCGAVASSEGDTVYNQVKDYYSATTTTPKEKALFLNALACSINQAQLLELRNEILGPEFIEPGHEITLLQRLVANPQSRPGALTFLFASGTEIITKLTTKAITDVVGTLSTFISTIAELETIKSVISTNDASFSPEEKDILNNYVKVIEGNIEWRTEHEQRLTDWFTGNV